MRLKWKKSLRLIVISSGIYSLLVFYIITNLGYSTRTVILLPGSNMHDYNLVHKYGKQEMQESRFYISTYKNLTQKNKKVQHMNMFYNVTSACNGILFTSHLARKDSWQTTDRNNTAYVFNAYLEKLKNELVIVGIKDGRKSKYYCQLWTQNEGSRDVKMEEKSAHVTVLPEGHGRRYTAVIFRCNLPPSGDLPTYVSLVTRPCMSPINLLGLKMLRNLNLMKRRFTVCLTPINFRYNRDYELIEWIELNRILGAEQFVVYNYSSAIKVKQVLDYYSKRGLTEVLQWNMPVGVDTWPKENKPVEIHYFGQIAALHDCLYRNKGISEFIVNLDLDEFIIPHGENIANWSEMLSQLKHSFDLYLFRNTFFKKEWKNSLIEIQNRSIVEKLRLVTLEKVQHETKISPANQRSKYFAKANDVSRLMIHGVPGVGRRLVVPVGIGLLHHYRDWETQGDPLHVRVLDKTVPEKFGKLLIKNVQTVWSDVNIY